MRMTYHLLPYSLLFRLGYFNIDDIAANVALAPATEVDNGTLKL